MQFLIGFSRPGIWATTMLSKYGNYMRLLKIKNKLKISCFTIYSWEEFSIFCGDF